MATGVEVKVVEEAVVKADNDGLKKVRLGVMGAGVEEWVAEAAS